MYLNVIIIFVFYIKKKKFVHTKTETLVFILMKLYHTFYLPTSVSVLFISVNIILKIKIT